LFGLRIAACRIYFLHNELDCCLIVRTEFIDFELMFIVDISLEVLDPIAENEGPYLPNHLQIPDGPAIIFFLPGLTKDILEQLFSIILHKLLKVFELPEQLIEQQQERVVLPLADDIMQMVIDCLEEGLAQILAS
jgi:hypothetical protein